MVFRLDLGQISFNLVKNAFATRQLAFLATGIAFYDISISACAEIKIFLFASVIDPLLGLLAVKKLLRKHHRDGQFYHGAARCSGRKFWS